MDNYFREIALSKANKIHEYSSEILKMTLPLCKSADITIASLLTHINGQSYSIKCLSEQLSGILKIN